MMTDDEIISVVQAHKEGKKIQVRSKNNITHDQGWFDILDAGLNPDNLVWWDFSENDYRVAPKPAKAREWWLDFKNGGRCAEVYTYNFCGDCVLVREVLND